MQNKQINWESGEGDTYLLCLTKSHDLWAEGGLAAYERMLLKFSRKAPILQGSCSIQPPSLSTYIRFLSKRNKHLYIELLLSRIHNPPTACWPMELSPQSSTTRINHPKSTDPEKKNPAEELDGQQAFYPHGHINQLIYCLFFCLGCCFLFVLNLDYKVTLFRDL